MKLPKVTAMIYHEQMCDDSHPLQSAKIWSNKLNHFDIGIHLRTFKDLYSVTNVTKLRNFQYRLLHNKIFCNNVLYHWKKVPSQYCEFCNDRTNKQDAIHLLYLCKNSRNIWEKISVEMHKKSIDFELNEMNVIYNRTHPKPTHVANFITLLTKFVIFRCKCKKVRPNFNHVYNEIKLYYNIELHIALKNNKLAKFKKKWALL